MHLYKFDKRKVNKLIAFSSALALTLSNSLSTVLAKENNLEIDNIVTGGVAKPYVPPNAKLDSNNKPILDKDGDFILLDEEGNIIPKEALEPYYIKPNSKGNIIYEIPNLNKLNANSRSNKKLVNLLSKNINIRSSASTSASIVGKLPSNKAATILEDNGTWAKIKYGSTTGWVSKEFTTVAHESPDSVVKNISSSNVNIRSSNSTSAGVVGKIPSGATGTALDSKNGWFKILYGDTVGWASGEYVKYVNTPSSQSLSVTSSELNHTTYVKDNSTNSLSKTSSYMKDSNGRQMYCLDPERVSPNGHPYYRGRAFDDTTYRILKYGYPNTSLTGDAATDRIITQMALWGHVDPSRLNINNITAYRNNAPNNDMLNQIKNLYNKAKSSGDTQTVSVNFSKTNLTATLSGDTFVTEYISLVGSGDIKSATTTLKFFDTATGQQRTDITAVLEDGQSVTSVGLNQKFRLSIPKSSLKGSIKIVGNSDIVHPMAIGYSTNLAGIQDSVTIEDVKENKAATNDVVVTWDGAGSFTLTKVDESSKEKLQGAEFSVTNSEGTHIATLVTDSNGIASSPQLPLGTYKVKETKAPHGYQLDPTVHTVQINSSTPITVTFTNKKITGGVQIIKVDAEDSNKLLSGAEFTLFDSNNNVVSKATTDSNGLASFNNIALGSYSLKETKAPHGYLTDGQAIPVTIKSQGDLIKLTVKNSKKIGEVDFSKTDVSTGEIVEGATIEITGLDEFNKHIKISFVSSKDGNRFKLPVGKYEFKETIAPEGYVLSTEVGTFEIKENGEVVKANLKNTPIVGAVQITKVDAEDENKKLKGAEFTLYDLSETELTKAISDDNGIAKFENIPYGEYIIKETKAPEGYLLIDAPIQFKVEEHNKTLTYTVTNSKKTGEVDFSKTDVSTGEIVEGATIEITGLDEFNKHIKISFVSSKDGNRFKLPVGKYEFKETIAPEGYVLSEEVGTFEIKENGEIVKANLKNTPITGTVEVLKVETPSTDSDDTPTTDTPDIDNPDSTDTPDVKSPEAPPTDDVGTNDLKKLAGAEFTIFNKEGKEILTATTDENGFAKFEKIPYGEYTLKETKSPHGYILVDKPIDFKIEDHNKTLSYTIENDRSTGEVEFTKTDVSTGELIEGAIIEITGIEDINKHINFTFISSKEGNTFSLPSGKYEFKETTAPDGYILSEEVGTFEIKENGEIVKANLKNTPFTVDLKVLKVDSKDKSPLAGAEFELKDSKGKKINSKVSDKDGILIFDNLKPGKYTLTETKAPTGYILSEKSIEIEVTTLNKVIELEVENKEKLAQTGGNFTFSGLILTGFSFMAVAAILSRKESGGKNNG